MRGNRMRTGLGTTNEEQDMTMKNNGDDNMTMKNSDTGTKN